MNNELESKTYSVPEAGQVLGLSRGAAYKAVARGEIPALKFGDRSLRVTKAAIERLLANGE